MRANFSLAVLVLAAVLLPPGCASKTEGDSQVRTASGHPMAERLLDGKGLEHVARIHKSLYRGAQPSEEGYRTLVEMGIKTVICLRKHSSFEKEAEAAGLEYVAIPMQAGLTSTPPTDEQVEFFFDTVLDPSKQPVFFHCKKGKDRTGTMAAIYRMEREGWTREEAIEELQAFGYNDYFRDLIAFVREYKPRGFKPGK